MFVAQNVMSYIDKTNFLARWGCRLYMYKITGIRYSRQDRLFLATHIKKSYNSYSKSSSRNSIPVCLFGLFTLNLEWNDYLNTIHCLFLEPCGVTSQAMSHSRWASITTHSPHVLPMLRQSYWKSKHNIVFPFSRHSLLRHLERVVITVGKPVYHKVKRELTPEEKAEWLQWALTHENWTVATWAQGSWSSAAVLQMRYHRDAFKWKEININMRGYVFWNQLGLLVLDRELDCPAPDLQNLVRPE